MGKVVLALCALLLDRVLAFVPASVAKQSSKLFSEAPLRPDFDEPAAPAAAPAMALPVSEGSEIMSVIDELRWYDSSAATLDASSMVGAQPPFGFFDPVGFTKGISDEQLRWYRAAELKHGRVCMLAFTGWLVQSVNHVSFAGTIDSAGTSFKQIGELKFYEQWGAIPPAGRLQILSAIGLLEFVSEATTKPHYVFGGDSMGPNFWPFNLWYARFEDKPEKLKMQQMKELSNGRLAMLGVASLWSAHAFPGSVPFLPNPY